LSGGLAVRGRARRSLGEIDLAESDLREALATAEDVGDDELAADAHLGLAGVLSFAGRAEEGLEHLAATERLGSERLRTYAVLQRAILQQRRGLLDEALGSYDAALPTLRALDLRVDTALVLMNRGVIRTQTGALPDARADLTEAAACFDAEGNAFGRAQTSHGLGWVAAREGDLPRALQDLDDAHERFAALGHDALEVQVDRVEVLLAAGLTGEARQLAERTAWGLEAAGNHSQAAETWLLTAHAARLEGDLPRASTHAQRARLLFAQQGSAGWERAAHLEALRSSVEPADPAEAADLAVALEGAGNATGAAAAWGVACEAALARGSASPAARFADECARRADRLGVLEVRVLSCRAQASVAAACGDADAARRHVRRGLADVERHRAAVGATPARAAIDTHADALARLGLRLALSEGRAPAVLEWMERVRAGRRRLPPSRPPDDAELAAELAELRRVAAELRAAESAGDPRDGQPDLLDRQRQLEAAVHRRRLRSFGQAATRPAGPPTVAELREALHGWTLVELAAVDDRLVGVVVGGQRSRLVDLGPSGPVLDASAAVAASIRALATTTRHDGHREQRRALAARTFAVLDGLLRRCLPADGPLVLVVPAALHAVPWPVLPSCRGRPVAVAPSATWLVDADRSPRRMFADGALAVAGPRLTEAEREVGVVAARYAEATVLTGSAATAEAVTTALPRVPIAHVAAHGRLRHDNPMWSSLELADGPLHVYDLERVAATPPTVVLSACESGVGVRAGDQLLGLASSLLNLGTRSLVATVAPLPDTAETSALMAALHERLAQGTPATEALAVASLAAEEDLVGCLSCFGAPS
jgi:tetratricopeptide (TPR) repeat protein